VGYVLCIHNPQDTVLFVIQGRPCWSNIHGSGAKTLDLVAAAFGRTGQCKPSSFWRWAYNISVIKVLSLSPILLELAFPFFLYLQDDWIFTILVSYCLAVLEHWNVKRSSLQKDWPHVWLQKRETNYTSNGMSHLMGSRGGYSLLINCGQILMMPSIYRRVLT